LGRECPHKPTRLVAAESDACFRFRAAAACRAGRRGVPIVRAPRDGSTSIARRRNSSGTSRRIMNARTGSRSQNPVPRRFPPMTTFSRASEVSSAR
ncbi:hypothetical protein, partial [Burkholderia sp. BCC1985]|uniref:hypothetical protein n=1 Tax=Burkholderia sp. BCC1985 TaxID=2817442 RepID=UPI002AB13FF1